MKNKNQNPMSYWNKAKIKIFITLGLMLSLFILQGVEIIQVHDFIQTAEADVEFSDFFKRDEGGLSFTEFQGGMTSLSAEGYDPALVSSTDLREFIIKIINYALGFLGLVTVIIIVYGGVMYVTSAGDDNKVTTGKNAIKYALIGLLIIFGSFAFVNTVIKAGSGDQTTGQIRRITAGRTSPGFNSTAEEIKKIAEDIYNDFTVLSDITLEFQTIMSDAEKEVLWPANFPPKQTILSFLGGIKSKLSTISTKVPQYSSAFIKIKELEREVDRQIDTVRMFEGEKLYKILNGSTPYGYGTLDDLPDETWYEYLLGLPADTEGYTNYNQNLYNFWAQDGENSRHANWRKGVAFAPIIEEIKKEYINNLKLAFQRLHFINEELKTYFGASDGQSGQRPGTIYEKMRLAYGYSNDGSIDSNIAGFNLNVQNWKLFEENNPNYDPISPATAFLITALTHHSEFHKQVSEMKFVEARLTASAIEGSAPFTVIFDAIATNDPAGGTLKKENIIWDLGGSSTISDLMALNNYGASLMSSENMICDRDGTIIPEDELDRKIGQTSQRCTFLKPGTYQSAIKIKSNDPSKYAPGVSILTIRVSPPNTKINLKMLAGGEEIDIMRYKDDETLEIDRSTVPVTLEQAKVGLTFNASASFAEQYKWDFGNGDFRDFSGTPTATAIYQEAGKYNVKLEVLSKTGIIDRKIFTIEVSDLASRIIDPNKGRGVVNTDILFDGSSSKSDGGGIKSYEWIVNVSEGYPRPEGFEPIRKEGATLSRFTHRFEKPNTYDITLRVMDINGNYSTDQLFNFLVSSQKPIAQFTHTVPKENVPNVVEFDSSKSFDPDGDSKYLEYEWTIEAPNEAFRFLDSTTNTSKNPKIEFLKKGEYSVKLKVTDLLTSGTNIEFGEITKKVNIDKILSLEWGENSTTTSMLNEEGEAEINLELSSPRAIAFEMDFGDGNNQSGAFSGTRTITHRYSQAGKYKIKATVYDADEDDISINRTVFIGGGENPIAKIGLTVDGVKIYDFDSPIEITKKSKLVFDASDSKNTDGTGRKLNYSWDLGDTTRSSDREFNHSYKELSPAEPGYFIAKLTVFDRDNTSKRSTDEIKLQVKNLKPTFATLQGIPRLERGKNTTPITVLMKVFGAEDPDGRITQYRWWYYRLDEPDNELGMMITTNDSAQLIIGTMGREGEKINYGLGVEVMDNDNLRFSSRELYDENTVPKVEVVNGPNELPTASFRVNATKVFLGDPVIFTSTSTDPDGEILTYIWDFEGDGFHNNEPTDKATVEHIYTKKNLNGYDVRLKIRDDKGGEAVSAIVKLFVDSNAEPPVSAFDYSFPDPENKLKVQFTNKASVDEESGAIIAQTLWDFDINKDTTGDGIRNNDIDSREENPTWTYDAYGIYKVKLQVLDSLGEKSELIRDVVIADETNIRPSAEEREFQRAIEIMNIEKGTVEYERAMQPGTAEFQRAIEIMEITGPKYTGMVDALGRPIEESSLMEGSIFDAEGNPIIISPKEETETTIDKENLEPIKAILEIRPSELSGERDIAVIDFSKSTGPIKYFSIDKNIFQDSFPPNGILDDDYDYISDKAGTWQTTFFKEWGEIAVKLTVYDEYGREDSVVKKIVFK
jgi:PKD repeat protein